MRYFITIITVFAIAFISNRLQAQEERWTQTYYIGEYSGGSDIAMNPNGGYFWTGMIQPEDHSLGTQALLVSIDSQGDTLWTRNYGRGEDERFTGIQILNNQIRLTGLMDSTSGIHHYLLSFFIVTSLEGDIVEERWFQLGESAGILHQVGCCDHPYMYTKTRDYLVVRLDEQGNPLWSTFRQPEDDSYWTLVGTTLLPAGGIVAALSRTDGTSDSLKTCLAWISESGVLEDTVFVSEQYETYCPCVAVLSQNEVVVAGLTRNSFVFYDDYPIIARISRELDDPVWQIVRDFIGFEYTSLDTVNGSLWASYTSYNTELGPAPVFISSFDLNGMEIDGMSVYPEVNGYHLGSSSTSNGEDGVVIIGNGSRDSSYVWLTEIVSPTNVIKGEYKPVRTLQRLIATSRGTRIELTVPESLHGMVQINTYNILGQLVNSISHFAQFQTRFSVQLPNTTGTYILEIETSNNRWTTKVSHIR